MSIKMIYMGLIILVLKKRNNDISVRLKSNSNIFDIKSQNSMNFIHVKKLIK